MSFLADYNVSMFTIPISKTIPTKSQPTPKKIAAVHGSNHPETIEIASIFNKIATDLATHLKEEEEIFFPALKRVDVHKKKGTIPPAKDIEMIKDSLQRLTEEHEEIGDAIHKIRRLAGEYTIPENVCNTFVVTYQKLKEFEDDLHKHVHLENNILFPKAVQLEQE